MLALNGPATLASLAWVGEAVCPHICYQIEAFLTEAGTANYPYLDAPIDAIKRKAANVTYYSSDSFPSGLTVAVDDIAIVFITSVSLLSSRNTISYFAYLARS